MKITKKQQNILLNLLLEKMQEIVQINNTDVKNVLKDYAIMTENKFILQSVLNIAYELGLIKKKCEV